MGVIGPQQRFLEMQQPKMWKEGDLYRKKPGIELKYDPRIAKFSYDQSKKVSQMNHHQSQHKNSKQQQQQQEEQKNDGTALPTDPGQNQGSALKQAKAKGQSPNGKYWNKNSNNQNNVTSDDLINGSLFD